MSYVKRWGSQPVGHGDPTGATPLGTSPPEAAVLHFCYVSNPRPLGQLLTGHLASAFLTELCHVLIVQRGCVNDPFRVDRLRLTFNSGDQESASGLLTLEQRVSTGLLRGFGPSTPWKRLLSGDKHQHEGSEEPHGTHGPAHTTEGGMPRPPAPPPRHYLIRKKSKCPSRLLVPSSGLAGSAPALPTQTLLEFSQDICRA